MQNIVNSLGLNKLEVSDSNMVLSRSRGEQQMKELTKVFNGTELEVEMIDDESFYINVSGIARANGKNFSDWVTSKKTKEIFKLKEISASLKKTELVVQSGNKTLIHNKVLVNFARFVSVEFEDWCDNTIYDILTGKYKIELEAKNKEIAKIKSEKKLCNTYTLNGSEYSSCRGVAQRSNLKEKDIKPIFEKLGYIQEELVLTRFWRPTEKGMVDGIVSIDSKGTPIYNIDETTNVVNQYYNLED